VNCDKLSQAVLTTAQNSRILIAAGIAVVIIVAVQTTGTNLQGAFNSVATALQ
jgi:hypothetical protein